MFRTRELSLPDKLTLKFSGTTLPPCVTIANADNDPSGANSLVVANAQGDLALFKGIPALYPLSSAAATDFASDAFITSLEDPDTADLLPYATAAGLGPVTSIVVGRCFSDSDDTGIIIVTAEGSLYLFHIDASFHGSFTNDATAASQPESSSANPVYPLALTPLALYQVPLDAHLVSLTPQLASQPLRLITVATRAATLHLYQPFSLSELRSRAATASKASAPLRLGFPHPLQLPVCAASMSYDHVPLYNTVSSSNIDSESSASLVEVNAEEPSEMAQKLQSQVSLSLERSQPRLCMFVGLDVGGVCLDLTRLMSVSSYLTNTNSNTNIPFSRFFSGFVGEHGNAVNWTDLLSLSIIHILPWLPIPTTLTPSKHRKAMKAVDRQRKKSADAQTEDGGADHDSDCDSQSDSESETDAETDEGDAVSIESLGVMITVPIPLPPHNHSLNRSLDAPTADVSASMNLSADASITAGGSLVCSCSLTGMLSMHRVALVQPPELISKHHNLSRQPDRLTDESMCPGDVYISDLCKYTIMRCEPVAPLSASAPVPLGARVTALATAPMLPPDEPSVGAHGNSGACRIHNVHHRNNNTNTAAPEHDRNSTVVAKTYAVDGGLTYNDGSYIPAGPLTPSGLYAPTQLIASRWDGLTFVFPMQHPMALTAPPAMTSLLSSPNSPNTSGAADSGGLTSVTQEVASEWVTGVAAASWSPPTPPIALRLPYPERVRAATAGVLSLAPGLSYPCVVYVGYMNVITVIPSPIPVKKQQNKRTLTQSDTMCTCNTSSAAGTNTNLSPALSDGAVIETSDDASGGATLSSAAVSAGAAAAAAVDSIFLLIGTPVFPSTAFAPPLLHPLPSPTSATKTVAAAGSSGATKTATTVNSNVTTGDLTNVSAVAAPSTSDAHRGAGRDTATDRSSHAPSLLSSQSLPPSLLRPSPATGGAGADAASNKAATNSAASSTSASQSVVTTEPTTAASATALTGPATSAAATPQLVFTGDQFVPYIPAPAALVSARDEDELLRLISKQATTVRSLKDSRSQLRAPELLARHVEYLLQLKAQSYTIASAVAAGKSVKFDMLLPHIASKQHNAAVAAAAAAAVAAAGGSAGASAGTAPPQHALVTGRTSPGLDLHTANNNDDNTATKTSSAGATTDSASASATTGANTGGARASPRGSFSSTTSLSLLRPGSPALTSTAAPAGSVTPTGGKSKSSKLSRQDGKLGRTDGPKSSRAVKDRPTNSSITSTATATGKSSRHAGSGSSSGAHGSGAGTGSVSGAADGFNYGYGSVVHYDEYIWTRPSVQQPVDDVLTWLSIENPLIAPAAALMSSSTLVNTSTINTASASATGGSNTDAGDQSSDDEDQGASADVGNISGRELITEALAWCGSPYRIAGGGIGGGLGGGGSVSFHPFGSQSLLHSQSHKLQTEWQAQELQQTATAVGIDATMLCSTSSGLARTNSGPGSSSFPATPQSCPTAGSTPNASSALVCANGASTANSASVAVHAVIMAGEALAAAAAAAGVAAPAAVAAATGALTTNTSLDTGFSTSLNVPTGSASNSSTGALNNNNTTTVVMNNGSNAGSAAAMSGAASQGAGGGSRKVVVLPPEAMAVTLHKARDSALDAMAALAAVDVKLLEWYRDTLVAKLHS